MKLDVINIFGMSYSGSTLLNFMLDCVAEVYGGGELHWLLTQHAPGQTYKAHCTHCKENCPIWTPAVCSGIESKGFYSTIAGLTDAKVIVDTSKMLSWFIERQNMAESNITYHNVLLVKHPLRHITSLLTNAGVTATEDKHDAIEKAIGTFDSYYRETFGYLQKNSSLIVHYEDLVLQNLQTINRILSLVDLKHNRQTLDCFDYVHHQIGGNAGPIYLATKEWPTKRHEQPKERLKHYESKTGVFIDNKYQEFLNDAEINHILDDCRIQHWQEQLNFVLTENAALSASM